jgi:uroporphyrinogen decarboxylase
MNLRDDHPLNLGLTSKSRLILSMRGERTAPLPIWFMRQAGRSLPEYREIRANTSMLESCLTPELAMEITLQPVRRHGVDAAIFFSDIVVPLKLAGIEVEIVPGVGPVIENPIDSSSRLEALNPLDDSALTPIRKAVLQLTADLGAVPLIGFGGAPFTVASYLIEGGPSKTLTKTRALMKEDPEAWYQILSWCATVTAQFIRAQVESGASALQVFDSWAGKLSPSEYEKYAAPYSKQLFDQLSDLTDYSGNAVPRVHFGVGTGPILKLMRLSGATVMGIDSATSFEKAVEILGNDVPLQGNIDINILSKPWPEIEAHVKWVLAEGAKAQSHIVNLGHGVPKETNPDVLTRIVELVHEVTA